MYLGGMSPQGYPALPRLHNQKSDITTDDVNPNFNTYVLTSVPASSMMANTNHGIPLNTLFGAERLGDVKRVCAGKIHKLQDLNVNTDEEYKREIDTAKSLFLNGLELISGALPIPTTGLLSFNNIPAFEIIGEDTVKVAAGEVYCRFMIPGGELCRHNEMFSNESNLCSHVNRHRGVTVKTRGSGMLKMSGDDESFEFYKQMIAYTRNHNTADYESDALESIGTPVSVKQLSIIAEHPEKCGKCPTAKRGDCGLWALFEVDDQLKNARPPPSKRKASQVSLTKTPRSARKTPKMSAPVPDPPADDDDEIKTLEIIKNRCLDFEDFGLDCSSATQDAPSTVALEPGGNPFRQCFQRSLLAALTLKGNPGWTSHLPGKDSLLCQAGQIHITFDFNVTPDKIAQFAGDKACVAWNARSCLDSKFLTSWNTRLAFGSPVELPNIVSSESSVPGRDIALKVDSVEARKRAPPPEPTHSEIEATNSKAHSVEKAVQSLEKEKKALQLDKKTLQAEKKALTKEVKVLKEKLRSRPTAGDAAMEAKIDELQALADQRLAEIGVLTVEIARVTPINFNSGTEAAPSVRELEDQNVREDLTRALRELSLTSARNKTLEEQATKLKERLSVARGTNAKFQITTHSIEVLNQEVASLNRSIEEKKSTISRMENEIQDLGDLRFEAQLVSQLQGELQTAQMVASENLELRDKLEILEGDELNRSSLKRKVEQALFAVDGPSKRMKPSTEVNQISLDHPSLSGITHYLSAVHNGVMRVAATGGLISPLHFDVTKSGTIAITKLGLERANLFTAHKSQPLLIQNWTKEKSAEMSARVRELMHRGGFFNCGHLSLLRLKNGLENGGEMNPGSLVDALNEASAQTLDMRLQMRECMTEFQSKLKSPWTDEDTAKLKPFLLSPYSKYDDR
ncbi:hypothetical protein G7Z17_g1155 [Cylindrodendrum hubeiense]|uniref:Uncharacterized protein n=1 Tax=Cylindrodendrum hubeiense TaxID=595255 RepID=A0A9P5HQS3_9HYPO|nr:hypothetical protein G7Z17_g1155 [Cylindrodendrum hubeiense]